jgi:hypothetical protein
MLSKLKDNLAQAQARAKKYDDLKIIERQITVGNMVYVKLQPFRHHAFGIHQSLKLTTKFYGPFKVTEKIGVASYRLQLAESAEIHPIFHVSQLKQHLGPKVVPQANLPLVTSEGYIKTEQFTVLETRALSRRDEIVTQWRVHWHNLTTDQATWEDKNFIKATFPNFYRMTIEEWWPPRTSCGQEATSRGGSCQVLKPETATLNDEIMLREKEAGNNTSITEIG